MNTKGINMNKITVAICCVLIFLMAGCKKKENDSEKVAVIKKISDSAPKLLRLSKIIEDNIPGPMYIQHRSKANDYYYFNYVDGRIQGNFTPGGNISAEIKKHASEFKFRDIWKSTSENYITYSIERRGKQFALVLVLKNGENKFRFSDESGFNKFEILDNVNRISEFSQKPFIFVVRNNIYVYVTGKNN